METGDFLEKSMNGALLYLSTSLLVSPNAVLKYILKLFLINYNQLKKAQNGNYHFIHILFKMRLYSVLGSEQGKCLWWFEWEQPPEAQVWILGPQLVVPVMVWMRMAPQVRVCLPGPQSVLLFGRIKRCGLVQGSMSLGTGFEVSGLVPFLVCSLPPAWGSRCESQLLLWTPATFHSLHSNLLKP